MRQREVHDEKAADVEIAQATESRRAETRNDAAGSDEIDRVTERATKNQTAC